MDLLRVPYTVLFSSGRKNKPVLLKLLSRIGPKKIRTPVSAQRMVVRLENQF